MSENINQIEPPPDSLSLVEINANINNFLKQTQSQFECDLIAEGILAA